jgi:hypothetical protein
VAIEQLGDRLDHLPAAVLLAAADAPSPATRREPPASHRQ